jgi:hypothetical protein
LQKDCERLHYRKQKQVLSVINEELTVLFIGNS